MSLLGLAKSVFNETLVRISTEPTRETIICFCTLGDEDGQEEKKKESKSGLSLPASPEWCQALVVALQQKSTEILTSSRLRGQELSGMFSDWISSGTKISAFHQPPLRANRIPNVPMATYGLSTSGLILHLL